MNEAGVNFLKTKRKFSYENRQKCDMSYAAASYALDGTELFGAGTPRACLR